MKRPNWTQIYADCVGPGERPDELVTVTRETANLARHALRLQNETDAYHNYVAAEQELLRVLES